MSKNRSLTEEKKERKYTEIRKQVGKRIKEFRKQRNFSQERLASKINKSVDAISAIERGINFPGDETIEAISVALKQPIFEFYRLEKKVDERVYHKKSEHIQEIVAILQKLDERDLRVIKKQVQAFKDVTEHDFGRID